MPITIIFPPRSSPTYVPLGCATLSGLADGQLRIRDENLALWRRLALSTPAGAEVLRLIASGDEGFYDQETYQARAHVLGGMGAQLATLAADATRYVETGERSSELSAWLAEHLAFLAAGETEMLGYSVLFPEQLAFSLASARYSRDVLGYAGKCLLGGATVAGAVDAEHLLRGCSYVDAVVYQEGEPIVSALLAGVAWAALPGVWLRADGVIRKNPTAMPPLILPRPSFSQLPIDEYLNPMPVLPASGSRGCAWHRCRFCAHNRSFGRFRRFPGEIMVAEMNAAAEQFGVRHFYLADQYVEPAALEELSDALLQSGSTGFHFHVMARPTADYTPQLLEKASAAGCCWISWGLESGSQRLLDMVGKGTHVSVVEKVLRHSAAAGISSLGMMIFGLPTSTEEDFELTSAFLMRVQPFLDAMTASSFALFDGTPFARRAATYDIRIHGRERLFHMADTGVEIHSTRLFFSRTGEAEGVASRCGREEIEAWERRRAWLGGPRFMEQLPCEHYLLYASRARSLRPYRLPPLGRPTPGGGRPIRRAS